MVARADGFCARPLPTDTRDRGRYPSWQPALVRVDGVRGSKRREGERGGGGVARPSRRVWHIAGPAKPAPRSAVETAADGASRRLS